MIEHLDAAAGLAGGIVIGAAAGTAWTYRFLARLAAARHGVRPSGYRCACKHPRSFHDRQGCHGPGTAGRARRSCGCRRYEGPGAEEIPETSRPLPPPGPGSVSR